MYSIIIFVGNDTAQAQDNIDYYTSVAVPNFDTIPAYTRQYTLIVGIEPDHILENNETFQVTPQPQNFPTGYVPSCFLVNVNITDDDGNKNYAITV